MNKPIVRMIDKHLGSWSGYYHDKPSPEKECKIHELSKIYEMREIEFFPGNDLIIATFIKGCYYDIYPIYELGSMQPIEYDTRQPEDYAESICCAKPSTELLCYLLNMNDQNITRGIVYYILHSIDGKVKSTASPVLMSLILGNLKELK